MSRRRRTLRATILGALARGFLVWAAFAVPFLVGPYVAGALSLRM